jgi:protein-L-isoaspartate(D-aspartate) O-methyltransferase
MDFTAQREKMVDSQIRTTDVTSHSVLRAFLAVPREAFVPERLKAVAYIDSDIEIAPGRHLMQPSPLAKLLQLAEIDKSASVLEIGAGSGYVTTLLSELAGSVTALESDPSLLETAKANLAGRQNVELVSGSLASGFAARAPYDVIFFSGAVDQVPDAIIEQLKQGGRAIVIVGRGHSAAARLIVREGRGQSVRSVFNASVHSLPGFEEKPEFAF